MSVRGLNAGQSGRRPEAPLPTPPPKRRRRPPLACFQCRRRKVKCDQNRPCNNCTKAKIPDCNFPPSEIPGSLDHGPDIPTPQTRGSASVNSISCDSPSSQDLPTLHRQVSVGAFTEVDPAITVHSTSSSALQLNTETRSRHVSQSPHSDQLLQKIKELEETVKKLSNDRGSAHQASNSLNTTCSITGNNASGLRFGNQSSWINGTSLFSNILRPLGKAQAEKSQLHQATSSFKALARQIDQYFAVPVTPIAPGTRIPEKPLADAFLENYFSHFEGWLRVLHVPSFRSEYIKFWQQRDTVNQIFVLQLQLCMALGITVHPDCLIWKNAANQWIHEGRRWLQDSFERAKKKPSFEEVQLACLVLIAEANASENDQMHQCWVSVGQLVRRSMYLGLHREPRHVLPNPSVIQAEMRRRLWMTVLELNLMLSLQAGQPTLVYPSDYDICPPSNMTDEELTNEPDETRSSEGIGSSANKQTRTTPQLALFDSFLLRSELVNKLNGIGQTMSYDEVLRFHKELSKAKGRMQQKFRAGDTATASTNFAHNSIANILLSRYLLALHLPVLGRSIRNPTFHFSRRFCITASIEMVKVSGILESGQGSGPRASNGVLPSLKTLFVNSPGLFRHIAIQAIFALSLELVTSQEEEHENTGAFPVWDTAELFRFLKAAESWCADRLQAGISDHLGYCFVGACLAYARSLGADESATDLDQVVVQAALRNVENCSRMMREVAEKLGVPVNQGPSMTAGAGNVSALLPDVVDVSMDLTSGFFGVGMDGFAFDWTYPVDFGLEPTWGLSTASHLVNNSI
ncbi:unnamed protein product [Clonostachys rosea]|uniref:Zn(2)-C6 fungal-type domain-containing protein n=1 Tax=Bionectria ochroleuca TaxID=29856 RepID=A0ABY6UN18_BIOOC|nr:unnamed protein product [Clonostachys rosea]